MKLLKKDILNLCDYIIETDYPTLMTALSLFNGLILGLKNNNAVGYLGYYNKLVDFLQIKHRSKISEMLDIIDAIEQRPVFTRLIVSIITILPTILRVLRLL